MRFARKQSRLTEAAIGILGVLIFWGLTHESVRRISQAAGKDPSAKIEEKNGDDALNKELTHTLTRAGFTGKTELTLEKRLNRKVNQELADVGNQIFFDKLLALGNDNTCAGCHSPTHAFGDTQSIAIGVSNNDVVGTTGRVGPRNQARTPSVINNAFYPRLMWNGRFAATFG